jgi:stage III sporulation protein SpoIIIAA
VSVRVNDTRAPFHPPVTDDLKSLLECLPPQIQRHLEQQSDLGALLEVVLDLGRLPEARFAAREAYLGGLDVTLEDIQYVVGRVSAFGDDNRAGIERTLHRISAMRNRSGQVVGLTCRVGRAIFGAVRVVDDLVASGQNILLVGRPGVGKTTMLREMARVLADDAHQRVVIVDTSNEIAGEGDVPHPAIGRARRMHVATPVHQHAVMIEAVENHMPQVIIIDEMGTEEEARAARTIAERGVQLIATAHGNTLENLVINPTLSDLVGGVQTVTLSDEEARRRHTQKAILERKAPPTFDVLIEIQNWDRVAVHADVAHTVDRLLRGQSVMPEVRWLDEQGQLHRSRQRRESGAAISVAASDDVLPPLLPDAAEPRWLKEAHSQPDARTQTHAQAKLIQVHPFGVSRQRLAQAAQEAGVMVQMADAVVGADLVLTTKVHYRKGSSTLRDAEDRGVPVFVLRRNTGAQLKGFVERLAEQMGERRSFGDLEPGNEVPSTLVGKAVEEAEAGVDRILNGEMATVELEPQSAYVRRIQHQIVERAQLRSRSFGHEPRRRVTITGG